MPIYEYRCQDCNKLTSVFLRSMTSAWTEPRCEACGSVNLVRAISRFAVAKTESQVLDSYGDPAYESDADYRDPRQIGRWVEKKFEDYGMEMPHETRDMIDRAREGEMPAPLNDDA